ncbi:MAG: hypothetical protein M0Z77_08950 [Thermoplasmatales archaeon]|jgi:hypothetical protein|nr:hypothetical protein [Candidatus Thermoplasmatota archaeon]MCL6003463.1 hypothetical protein [Candidatus Thermoplasmatota archaeon]MDA8055754.1 hypothetical protein [Thermoplasmatales archaeon]
MAGRRLTNTILTGVVAVIVIAAIVIVPFEVLESTHPFHQTTTQPPPSSTHLGMLNSTQVGNVTGGKVKEVILNKSDFFLQSSQKPINRTIAYFNRTVNFGIHVLVGSFEFSSNSSASLFVTQIDQSEISQLQGYQEYGLTVNNSSYDGFHFTTISLSLGLIGSNVFIAAGESGNFAFAIYSTGGTIFDPTTLVQDEIATMTG